MGRRSWRFWHNLMGVGIVSFLTSCVGVVAGAVAAAITGQMTDVNAWGMTISAGVAVLGMILTVYAGGKTRPDVNREQRAERARPAARRSWRLWNNLAHVSAACLLGGLLGVPVARIKALGTSYVTDPNAYGYVTEPYAFTMYISTALAALSLAVALYVDGKRAPEVMRRRMEAAAAGPDALRSQRSWDTVTNFGFLCMLVGSCGLIGTAALTLLRTDGLPSNMASTMSTFAAIAAVGLLVNVYADLKAMQPGSQVRARHTEEEAAPAEKPPADST